jgi:hypothetical protein
MRVMRPAGRRARCAALALTLAAVTAGAAVLMAGSAQAVVIGSEPGTLMLSPASGSTLLSPTWSTSTPCPAGYQGSAAVNEFGVDNGITSNTVTDVSAPFSGTLLFTGETMANVFFGGTPPVTVQFVVECAAGADLTGATEYVQSIWVTESADGTTYTTSATYPQQATITTLTVSPSPAPAGATVDMTATVAGPGGAIPAGNVQFEAGGTDIGGPVALNPLHGTAFITTTVGAVGIQTLSAVFTATPIAGYGDVYTASTGTYTLSIQPSDTQTAGSVPIGVAVPPTGTLTVTLAPGTADLTEQGTTAPFTATGALPAITVTDTRNTYPGWSVSAEESAFTGSGTAAGSTLVGDQLGWAPNGTVAGGATLGPPLPPALSQGLGDAPQVLADAIPGSGFGTSTLSASLTLDIPDTAFAGPYTGDLTITYLETGP